MIIAHNSVTMTNSETRETECWDAVNWARRDALMRSWFSPAAASAVHSASAVQTQDSAASSSVQHPAQPRDAADQAMNQGLNNNTHAHHYYTMQQYKMIYCRTKQVCVNPFGSQQWRNDAGHSPSCSAGSHRSISATSIWAAASGRYWLIVSKQQTRCTPYCWSMGQTDRWTDRTIP